MKFCNNQHPIDTTGCVRCTDVEGHEGDHSFGAEPGMAVWQDGEKAWRYRPYLSVEEYNRLHGVDG